MSPSERLRAALDRVKHWMRRNSPLLVDNLAPGASPETVAALERELGFEVPADLRALWQLHDGQRSDQDGFVGALDLFATRQVADERTGLMSSVEELRDNRDRWPEAGVSADEVSSDRWLPFAGRDSDLLVVSAMTGRVFTCRDDVPALHLIAESVTEWAEQYAARVEAGAYTVEEGFGHYYLARDDGMH